MAEKENKPDLKRLMESEEFAIVSDGNPPKNMIIVVPIDKYSKDKKDGLALLYGKLRTAEAFCSRIFQNLMQREEQVNGVVKPGVIKPEVH